MAKLVSYLGDSQLKEKFLAEIVWHEEQDKLVQGSYESNGKFCAVGCSIHSLNKLKGEDFSTSDHKIYETQLGVPEWLARLEDTIFEGLPKADAMKWPRRFAQAIPVGVDLDPIKWKFCAFILAGNIERVLTLDIADELKEQVVNAIRGVLTLHETAVKTGEWDESAAESAESAAWSAARSAESAAWSAAWSAARSAESAAWSAARSAARSARSAARSAAWSAARSAESAARSARSAESAAWSARSEYQKYADKLTALLEEVE